MSLRIRITLASCSKSVVCVGDVAQLPSKYLSVGVWSHPRSIKLDFSKLSSGNESWETLKAGECSWLIIYLQMVFRKVIPFNFP